MFFSKKNVGGAILALSLFLITPCEGKERLINAKSSIEAVANSVLKAVTRKDVKSLETLYLTKDEFKRYIWPEIPWSRPERNMPFDYYWGDLNQKSSWALKRVLVRHGGKKYELIRVYFAKGVREYKNFRLYRDTRLIVRDETGKKKELNIFGSIVELNGKFKILSYIHE